MRTVVDPAFHSLLVNKMVAAGKVQATLAREAHVSPSYLSEIINGKATPSPDVARALDDALDACGELAVLVHPLLADDDADRFAAAVAHPTRIDERAVDDLATVLAAQRHLDDTLGSAALLKPVRIQLDQIGRLVSAARGPVRVRLVDVAAQWAQFLGWLNVSVGRYDEGDHWFQVSLLWASEAGDRDLSATVLSYQGHIAWLTAHPGPSIGLAEAALRDPDVYPGQRAYDAYAAARGHAIFGELVHADRLIGLGDELAEQSNTWSGVLPPWQYYRAAWVWHLERGLVHRYATRHDPSRARKAIVDLRAGVEGVPAEMRSADWFAEYLVHLASAYLDDGRRDAAAATLTDARAVAEGVRSERVLRMVDGRERRLHVERLTRR
jgi:transcriptional regulator with XRE-family HTH domain